MSVVSFALAVVFIIRQFVFVTYFTNPSVSDRVLCKLIFVKNVVSVEHAMFYVFLPNAVHI